MCVCASRIPFKDVSRLVSFAGYCIEIYLIAGYIYTPSVYVCPCPFTFPLIAYFITVKKSWKEK